LKKLLLDGSIAAKYARNLFSYNGLVDTRLEVSFYSTKLKKPKVIIFIYILIFKVYRNIIKYFFPRGTRGKYKNKIVNYPCFNRAYAKDYWKILFSGEKKFGRVVHI
jgi:hypothetical protein